MRVLQVNLAAGRSNLRSKVIRRGSPILAALLMVTLSAVWLQPARAQTVSGITNVPDFYELERAGLKQVWYAQVPMARFREKVVRVTERNGVVLVQSSMGVMHCLDANTGKMLWSSSVSSSGFAANAPAIAPEAVYTSSDRMAIKLNRSNGKVLVKRELPTSTSAGPAVWENVLFVPMTNQMMVALNMREGNQPKTYHWPEIWRYTTDGRISSPPFVLPLYHIEFPEGTGDEARTKVTDEQPRVALLSDDGVLHVFKTLDKTILFRVVFGSPVSAPMSTYDHYAYVSTADTTLHCVDLLDLNQVAVRWRSRGGYPLETKPLAYAEDVYITPTDGGMVCLDAKTGATRWRVYGVSRAVGATKDLVFASDVYGRFRSYTRAEGKPVGKFELRGFNVPVENQETDRLFLCSDEGLMFCLRPNSGDAVHQHPQREIPLSGKEAPPSPNAKKKSAGDDADEDSDAEEAEEEQ